jgi:hypothetical protein
MLSFAEIASCMLLFAETKSQTLRKIFDQLFQPFEQTAAYDQLLQQRTAHGQLSEHNGWERDFLPKPN